ncbi:MAG: TIGR04149 family rSAM-modified RiPP [Bacteroidales bacterium]|jgi:natural product precursor|nr:TIGR04149 family rSAM-modified RiPP [Bacteroidales bacterium]
MKTLKLNAIASNNLSEVEMNHLKGGERCCCCSCSYAGSGGGSSIAANSTANYNIGENGGHSTNGETKMTVCIDVGPLA